MDNMFEQLDKNQEGQNAQMKDFQTLWKVSASVSIPDGPEPGQAWSALQQKIAEQPERRVSLWPRLSSGLALAALLLAAVWLYQPNQTGVDYTTARGQRMTLQDLPDHSLVTLNADSKISFGEGFNQTHRQVHLQGEAFFSVEKGQHPFVIQTDVAEVRVLGTRFNVRSRDGKVAVDVEEGRVSVTVMVNGQELREILTAGSGVSCTSQGFTSAPRNVFPSSVAKWREEFLHFKSQPLSEIAAEVERYWDIHITIPQKEVRDESIEGALIGGPEDMVTTLCKMGGNAQFTETSPGYYTILREKNTTDEAPAE